MNYNPKDKNYCCRPRPFPDPWERPYPDPRERPYPDRRYPQW